ncbi:MAG: ATP-binding protein [Marinibacterium sp.]
MFSRDLAVPADLRSPGPDRGRSLILIALAFAFVAYAMLAAPTPLIFRSAVAVGGTLAVTTAILGVLRGMRRRARRLALDMLDGFMSQDATPSYLVCEDGEIVSRNPAARRRFSDVDARTLAASLRSAMANPASILFRLQTRAEDMGAAREDIATRAGILRIGVHKLETDRFLWRIEVLTERAVAVRGSDDVPVPVLTVGRSGTILYMNEAARLFIGERVKSLDRLFDQLPVKPGEVNSVTTRQGRAQVVVNEFEASAGRRELYLSCLQDAVVDTGGAICEALPVALVKLTGDGRILSCNGAATHLLGDVDCNTTYLSETMQGLGRPIQDWLRETAAGDRGTSTEFLRASRTDREVFVQVMLTPLNEPGEADLLAVLNDATELKTLEAQFVQSQKMQAIGQLAGGVAHDFNNLLTAISGHCDLLMLRHDQSDHDYGDLVQISENANRAAALVGQLLAFSRKQTLRPEILDLRDTLSDLTHLLNRLVGEKVTLTLSHDPTLKPVRADKRQLEQVLMNLVVNARDAMPDGGEIRIETECLVLDSPLERDRATVPAGDYVTVKVSDEGTGIQADKLEKVFEPFFTTKKTGEGTGLGLSTVYGIVKQTGGFIFVDSVVGRGSSFTLYFPACDEVIDVAPSATTAPKTADEAARHGQGVVLLVEDEAPVRAFASRALRLRGYTVLEAESAEEALQILDDPSVCVDLFVTDVVMPGMDGPSWVRLALEARPDVRVVFVSGYAEGALGEAGPAIANSVFLPKPFSLTDLTETVHRQLH